MRSVLALGLLTAWCASAEAAGTRHIPENPRVVVRPTQGAASPGARFAVPGWTDEQTQHWLNEATSCAGCS
jgi:hypothetical protein